MGSLGEIMATKGGAKKVKAIETLQSLPGVGKATAEKLFKAGFNTIAKIASATQTKLVSAGLAAGSAKNILKAAKAANKVKKGTAKAKQAVNKTAKQTVSKSKAAVKKTTSKAKATAKKTASKAKSAAKKTTSKAKATAKKTTSKSKKTDSDHGGTGKMLKTPSLKDMLKRIKKK